MTYASANKLKMSLEEKVLVEAILSSGRVPVMVKIDTRDYLTYRNILEIEEFVSTHSDRRSKTFINNLIRSNR